MWIMKKTLIAVLILVLVAVAVWLWKNPQWVVAPATEDTLTGDSMNDTGMDQEDLVVDPVMTWDTTVEDTTDAEASPEDVLSPELQAKLEEQASIWLSGEEITEEDIKLIEEILNEVTNSVE